MTLVPYEVIGVGLCLLCSRLMELFNDEDRSYLSHLLPAGLQWVIRML